ncbi:MAG TPA: lysophospholipase [Candidatus Limnocylindria bacterium]|nr:lysophospholipase [Candidatus Limnocylindria bacterium]
MAPASTGPIVSTAQARDGRTLRTLHWAGQGVPRAYALFVHGIAEHAGRHTSVASALAAAGIETHAYDLRGFGSSDGPRAYVGRWSEQHDDVEDQLGAVRATADGRPVILYGHSMGGLIALGYVLSDTPRPPPDLLVLSAPAIAASVPRWKRALAVVLGHLAPRLAVPNQLPPGALSHDPQVEIDYRADPLNVHRTTARFGMELFAEQARLRTRLANRPTIPIPTYVFHGADNAIVPLAASAPLERLAGVTRRVYPGLRHEMHNEPDAATVVADTIAWIDRTLTTPRA